MKFNNHKFSALAISLALASATLSCAVTANETANKSADAYQYFTGKHDEYKQTSGKVVGSYIANWSAPSIVDTINGDNLSHLLYAFLTICGERQVPDAAAACQGKADFQLAENAQSVDKQFSAKFSQLKTKYKHLKILPSVGGWGQSAMFVPMSKTPESRAVFVQSVVAYLKNNPAFDGIDIDWEWPENPAEGQAYVELMKDLRAGFDQLSVQTGREYQITSAIGTGQKNVANIDYAQAAPYMDYIFMMTYDFSGGWSKPNIGHHTALKAHSANTWGFNGEQGMKNLLNAGVPAEKLVLGVAKYARGFDGVTLSSTGSILGGVATGLFPKKEQVWDEEGVAIYSRVAKDIIGPDGTGINGFEVIYDSECECSYAWRESDGAFVGFDHPRDIINKANFTQANNLAGLFSWEYGQDNGDLLNAMNHGLGNKLKSALPENTWLSSQVYLKGDTAVWNHTPYVAQWWTQGQEPGSASVWVPLDDASNLNWRADKVYTRGMSVEYKGKTYQAMWWTKGDKPNNGAPWQPAK